MEFGTRYVSTALEDEARFKAVVNVHGVLCRNGEKVDSVTENVTVYSLRQYSYQTGLNSIWNFYGR